MYESLCYTYLDVEYNLLSRRAAWPPCWQSVYVYPDEILVAYNNEDKCREESSKFLSSMFGPQWHEEEQSLALQT